MAFIVESLAVTLITEAVKALVSILLDVKDSEKQNNHLVAEIENFERALSENLRRVERSLPAKVNRDAIESLNNTLKAATEFIKIHRHRGSFKRLWNAKEAKEELQRLQKDINNAFQLALAFTNLEVALDAGERSTKFHSEMQEMFRRYESDSAQTKQDIHNFFGILVEKIHPLDNQLQTVVRLIKSLNQTPEPDHEMEKFFNDVLSSLPSRSEADSITPTEDNEFCDPITETLMIDPVKATDGYTYDRWTIIDHGLHKSPYTRKEIRIACDDVSLRLRLFERRPGADEKCREKRKSYRKEALTLAGEGYYAEALLRLANVLLWDDNDAECLEAHGQAKILQRQSQGSDRRSFEDLGSNQERVDQESQLGIGVFTGEISEAPDLRSNQSVDEESEVEFLQALESVEKLAAMQNPQESEHLTAAIRTLERNVKGFEVRPEVFQILLNLLRKEPISEDVEEALISTFAELGKARENLKVFASLPKSSEIIVGAFANQERPRVRFWAARTIADLVIVTDLEKIWQGSKFSTVIEHLGRFLGGEQGEDARFEALRALHNILEREDLAHLIRGLRSSLAESLAKLLFEFQNLDDSDHLLRLTETLIHLKKQGTKEDDVVEKSIEATRGALTSLLQLFAHNPTVQIQNNAVVLIGDVLADVIDVLQGGLASGFHEDLPERMYLKMVSLLIEKLSSSNVAREVTEMFVTSPSVLERLVKCLELETGVLHQGLIILGVITASKKGAAYVAASLAAMDFLSRGLSEANGTSLDAYAYGFIVECLCYHSQIDLSTSLHGNFAQGVHKFLSHGGANTDFETIGCALAFYLLRRRRNRKALSGTSIGSSLEKQAQRVRSGIFYDLAAWIHGLKNRMRHHDR